MNLPADLPMYATLLVPVRSILGLYLHPAACFPAVPFTSPGRTGLT